MERVCTTPSEFDYWLIGDCLIESSVKADWCFDSKQYRQPKSGELTMKQFMLKKSLAASIFVASLLVASGGATTLFAQDRSASDANMQILRDKVKADKKLMVAANMELTDAEAKAFWPVYESYQKDLQALNERLKKTILSYADAYNNNKLTDQSAKKLSDEVIAIDEDEVKLRKAYSAKLAGVLPGKKAARYLQIENKVRALLRYELAAEIPLVE
jgi:hypothetical protein